MEYVNIFIIVSGIILMGVLMLKYLNGDFSYDDKIISQTNILGNQGEKIGVQTLIHRQYHSGRIKVIIKKTYI